MDHILKPDTIFDPLIEALGTGVLVLDRRGHILKFNEAAENLLAADGRRLLSSFFAIPTRENEYQEVEILAHGKPVLLEIIFKRCTWADDEAWITTLRDVTSERWQATQNKLKSAFFENTFDGALITSLDGTILEVNRSFEEITGYSAEYLIGKTPRVLDSGTHDAGYFTRMFDILQEKGHFEDNIQNRTKDGDIIDMYMTISTVYDQDNLPVYYVSSVTDNSPKRKFLDRLKYLSTHDPYTRLPNRKLLTSTLKNILRRKNNRYADIAVLAMRIDNFDNLVEGMGHQITNRFLRSFAARIKSCLGKQTFVAHVEGSTFKCILDYQAEPELLDQITALYQGLKKSFDVIGKELFVTASTGIVIKDIDGSDVSTLLTNALIAMDESIRKGGNTFTFFSPNLSDYITDYIFYQSALRSALQNHDFYLVYQPQVSLEGAGIIAAECLIRWPHAERGLISPITFIKYAERCGLIEEIGLFVLREACKQTVAWRKRGIVLDHVSVNVSGKQLSSLNFLDDVLGVIAETSMKPEHLLLEVTESSLMENITTAREVLQTLSRHKIRIAIDDFGTGYSSLSQLRELPFDELKIDRSFVCNLVDSEGDQQFFKILMSMAEMFSLKVVVEGVEEAAQVDLVRDFGASVIQGYYFYKPLKVKEFEAAYHVEAAKQH